MIFPKSKEIESRTQELDQKLEELKSARQQTAEVISKVNQPDVLRSLVISMNRTAIGRSK